MAGVEFALRAGPCDPKDMFNGRLNRRELLIGAVGATTAAAFAALLPRDRALFQSSIFNSSDPRSRLRGGYYQRPRFNYIPNALYSADAATEKHAFEWDLKTGAHKLVETTLPTHVVETHPIETQLSILTTQKTGRASIVDWSLAKQVTAVDLPEGGFFYGHMVFSNDGSKVLGAIFLKDQGAGVGIFEFPSLRLSGFVPTPMGAAHDIVSLGASEKSSKELFLFGMARKENGSPSFALFDLDQMKVREIDTGLPARETPPTIPHLKDCGDHIIANLQEARKAGHLKNGELISFDKKTQTARTEIRVGLLDFDTDMLSLEYDPVRDFAWITVPYQNRIEVWDLRRGQSVQHITFPSDVTPTSVSFLPDQELVIVTSQTRFFAFNASDASQNAKLEENFPHLLLRAGHTAHTRLI